MDNYVEEFLNTTTSHPATQLTGTENFPPRMKKSSIRRKFVETTL